MKKDHDLFVSRGASIVVVAPHPREEVEAYWTENALPFDGIPDPDKRLGGLYRQEWKMLRLGLMPALFVVGSGGKIAWLHYSRGMSDIPANEDVLEAIAGES
jgi:peroxiredoxin